MYNQNRSSGRKFSELRKISINRRVNSYADAQVFVKFGDTEVICSATIEERVPHFLRNTGCGWISGEYSMLPTATSDRNKRESVLGKQTGRSQEIQRLIGRALRANVNLAHIGERQVIIDCDVIYADGGTRTAAITGSFVALKIAVNDMLKRRLIHKNPITDNVIAVSCAMYQGQAILDPDFNEDSKADVDANFVLTSKQEIVEIQSTSEKAKLSRNDFNTMLDLAMAGSTQNSKYTE